MAASHGPDAPRTRGLRAVALFRLHACVLVAAITVSGAHGLVRGERHAAVPPAPPRHCQHGRAVALLLCPANLQLRGGVRLLDVSAARGGQGTWRRGASAVARGVGRKGNGSEGRGQSGDAAGKDKKKAVLRGKDGFKVCV